MWKQQRVLTHLFINDPIWAVLYLKGVKHVNFENLLKNDADKWVEWVETRKTFSVSELFQTLNLFTKRISLIYSFLTISFFNNRNFIEKAKKKQRIDYIRMYLMLKLLHLNYI